jgi:hypothetical protein
MPSMSQRQPLPDPAPVQPPTCSACSKPMELARLVPHEHFINLRHLLFVCECGRTSEYFIAAAD